MHLCAHVAHLTEESEHVVRLAELVALLDQQTHLTLKVNECLEARDPLQRLKLPKGHQEAVIATGACGFWNFSQRLASRAHSAVRHDNCEL